MVVVNMEGLNNSSPLCWLRGVVRMSFKCRVMILRGTTCSRIVTVPDNPNLENILQIYLNF